MSDEAESRGFDPEALDYGALFEEITAQNPDLVFDDNPHRVAELGLRQDPLMPEEFSFHLNSLVRSIANDKPAHLRINPAQALLLAKVNVTTAMRENGPAALEADVDSVFGTSYGQTDDAPTSNRDSDLRRMIEGRIDFYNLSITDEEIAEATPELIVDMPALLVADQKLPLDIFVKMVENLLLTDPVLQKRPRNNALIMLGSRIRYIAEVMFGSETELREIWKHRSEAYLDEVHSLIK